MKDTKDMKKLVYVGGYGDAVTVRLADKEITVKLGEEFEVSEEDAKGLINLSAFEVVRASSKADKPDKADKTDKEIKETLVETKSTESAETPTETVQK